jgi:hypothetical protein
MERVEASDAFERSFVAGNVIPAEAGTGPQGSDAWRSQARTALQRESAAATETWLRAGWSSGKSLEAVLSGRLIQVRRLTIQDKAKAGRLCAVPPWVSRSQSFTACLDESQQSLKITLRAGSGWSGL